jgi:hypothetical protein
MSTETRQESERIMGGGVWPSVHSNHLEFQLGLHTALRAEFCPFRSIITGTLILQNVADIGNATNSNL